MKVGAISWWNVKQKQEVGGSNIGHEWRKNWVVTKKKVRKQVDANLPGLDTVN